MGLTLTALLLGLSASTPGDRVVVPVDLQVELLGKVLRYDRNFLARADGQVRVLVVYLPDAPESVRVGRQLHAALGARARLGDLPHQEELVPYEGAGRLAALARERRSTLILFAPGFAAESPALAAALEGVDTLSVSSTPEGVREGLVLGFDRVSGRPRMVLNLAQARRQHADFRAELLELMTVYR